MSKIAHWLRSAERWLDGHGRPAWLAAMVAGFVLAWPLGLAILGYLIWSGRMGCGWGRGEGRKRWRAVEAAGGGSAGGGSGNTAFDAYREATLKRLDEEQAAFAGFLDRLRRAKDQAEFDGFMAERARPAPDAA